MLDKFNFKIIQLSHSCLHVHPSQQCLYTTISVMLIFTAICNPTTLVRPVQLSLYNYLSEAYICNYRQSCIYYLGDGYIDNYTSVMVVFTTILGAHLCIYFSDAFKHNDFSKHYIYNYPREACTNKYLSDGYIQVLSTQRC